MSSKSQSRGRRDQAAYEGKPRPAGSAKTKKPASTPAAPVAARPLTRGRKLLFGTIAVLLPFLLLAGTELVLRATWASGALPLFVPVVTEHGDSALIANPRVASRWFSGVQSPPGPIPEMFALHKPANGLRIFALGESTTAGFPYPHNGAFSRLLHDALEDVVPADSVEVVNLGIAATSSYAMLDEADEVIAQHPDAVVIYAGHNEFYGALGAASTQAVLGGSPPLVRTYLRLERLRTVMALRDGVDWLRRRLHPGAAAHSVTLMETLPRADAIPRGGALYGRGESQFASNLRILLSKFSDAHVRVFIASQASNLRDQQPFAAPENGRPGGADSVYAEARRRLAAGDTAAAAGLFARARDLDVVRFRADAALNDTIRARAAAAGAVYVPVAERFAAVSPGGVPGYNLFLEHLHPNEQGAVLIARTFFDAIASSGLLGPRADLARLRDWNAYARGMDLTPFDERIVFHTRNAIVERWPFVPLAKQADYRRDYKPVGTLDSLALYVAAGGPWPSAKAQMAMDYARRNFGDSAVAEVRGLVRDSPTFAEPLELLGRAFETAGHPDSALVAYKAAISIRPSAAAVSQAGAMAMALNRLPEAIALLEQAVQLQPRDTRSLYKLSLAYGMSHDLPHARIVARRLWELDPRYPGLAGWVQLLGGRS